MYKRLANLPLSLLEGRKKYGDTSYLVLLSLLATVFFGQLFIIFAPSLSYEHISGYVDPKFANVERVFMENFANGLEREGASLVVYHKGKRVVNLWGGYADAESGRLWQKDTVSPYFSVTKAVASVCVAMMVDRGVIAYEDLVTDYWPEYGRNGKENTTIEHVLSHMAGLPFVGTEINRETVNNRSKIEELIENSTPVWTPGTATGYHAVSFGFLVDGIVRRADEKGRDVKTYLKEEIAEKYDLDIDIGLSKFDFHRMARLTQPGLLEYTRNIIIDPRMIVMLGLMYVRPADSLVHKVRSNLPWLHMSYDTIAVNDPDIVALNLPAVNGIGDADSLAKMFSLTLDGTLLSNRTSSLLQTPTLTDWHVEQVVLYPVYKGRGFFYEAHPTIPGAFTYGHPGYGGQELFVDPHNELVMVYISNGLKTATGVLCRTSSKLKNAIYRSLKV